MLLALPAIVRTAASKSPAVRSGSFVFAISSHWALEIEPTLVVSGFAAPFSTFAAFSAVSGFSASSAFSVFSGFSAFSILRLFRLPHPCDEMCLGSRKTRKSRKAEKAEKTENSLRQKRLKMPKTV